VRLLLLLFVAGSATVSLLPELPGAGLVLLLVPLALAALAVKFLRGVAVACLGFVWAAVLCNIDMSARLPAKLEGQRLVLDGTVSSLPRERDDYIQFQFRIDGCPDCWAHTSVRLTWYRPPWRHSPVRPGQRWRLPVRLKRPHGANNPGLFDYNGWLLSKGIGGTGYVLHGRTELLAGSRHRRLADQLRYWLRRKIQQSLPDTHIRSLLIALTVGESSQVSAADWQVLSDTGTNHLLVISGLHVGLVAALAYRVLLTILQWWVRSPARWAGLLSLALAMFYGAIAGMGLPVQRALVMSTVALSGRILDRNISTFDMYCYALLGVTLLEPLAVLNTGFWLSFGAVFTLIYAFAGRIDRKPAMAVARWGMAALRTQWAVFVGMLPMLLYFVFQASLLGCLVNLVAIPWIGVLVIPLLLLSIPAFAVGGALGAPFVQGAAQTLGVLWHLLDFAARQHGVLFAGDVGVATLMFGLAGAALLLSPKGVVPRWLGIVAALPLFALPRPLAPGEVTARIFDVGERVVAIVRSRDFRVVYETNSEPGVDRSVVTPMLRRFGDPRRLDALVVNGAPPIADEIRARFLIGSMYASDPGRLTTGRCNRRSVLHDGAVRFLLLRADSAADMENDRSCILIVRSGQFSLLLPGEIESSGEHHLLSLDIHPVDVLLAPHAGSVTSSSPALLNALAPRIAIFSTGYRNRFGHPSPIVVNRYRLRGSSTYNTAEDGEIRVDYTPGSGIGVFTARSRRNRFWYK